jgi:hypothetical protein
MPRRARIDAPCHWAIRSLGMTAVAVSKLLGISQSAVTRAAYRSEAIATASRFACIVFRDASETPSRPGGMGRQAGETTRGSAGSSRT